jgi:hypothetical protein
MVTGLWSFFADGLCVFVCVLCVCVCVYLYISIGTPGMVHVCDRFMELVCGRDCLWYVIDSWSLLALYLDSFDTGEFLRSALHSAGVGRLSADAERGGKVPENGQHRRDSVSGITDVSSIDISFGGRWDRRLGVDLGGQLGSACADTKTHELYQGSTRGADEALIQSVSQAVAKELRWWNVVDIKMLKLKRDLIYSQKRPTINGIQEAVLSDSAQDFSHTKAESFLLCSSES